MTLEQLFELAASDEAAGVAAVGKAPELAHRVEPAGDFQRGQAAPFIVHAAHRGMARLVEALLDVGADIVSRGVDGGTPLHVAGWIGSSAVVRLLLERGAPHDARCAAYGATPLLWACHGYSDDGAYPKQDQVGAARALLEAGADPNLPNRSGQMPFDLVRHSGRGEMARLLEAHGAVNG